MRRAMFQKTTAGPDSQTKCRTGGTFLSARRRSPQALPGAPGPCVAGSANAGIGLSDSWLGSMSTCASCLVEDMAPFPGLCKLPAHGVADCLTKVLLDAL